jgi:hypothetical protein
MVNRTQMAFFFYLPLSAFPKTHSNGPIIHFKRSPGGERPSSRLSLAPLLHAHAKTKFAVVLLCFIDGLCTASIHVMALIPRPF